MDINIFMVGGRRCGKTTVITSLWNNADKTLSGTNLSLTTSNSLMNTLQETFDLSESYFDDPDMESFVKVSDDNATFELKRYEFNLQVAGKKTGIHIQFTDVPGEFFDNPEHYEATKNEIRKSHAIIFAIDTPCLMENMDERGFGKRHVQNNKPENITHFIKDQLNVESIADRLLLFVPIKCEKYYYRREMPQVVEAVRNGYRELLEFIASPNLKEHCTAAVLPILSLGGLKFFGFENDSISLTAGQEYIYHANCGNEAKYQPLYCDQPLLYTIAYILKTTKGYRNGPLWSLRNALFNTVDGKTLRNELVPLTKKICRDEKEGFVLLQDPLLL